MFAGSCIGVVFLVMSLEFLRRCVKEYDRFLLRKYTERLRGSGASQTPSPNPNGDSTPPTNCAVPGYRPTIIEQAVRSLLHMFQSAVAYFIMLCVSDRVILD